MNPSNPLEQFLKWETSTPSRVFLRQPFNGIYTSWTWAQAGDEARRVAQGLQSLGLPPKSHIAILSKNCAHWILADLAIMMAGHISIPIYPTLNAESIRPIIEHSDTRAIFIGKLDDFQSQQEGIPAQVIQISFDSYGIKLPITWETMVMQHAPLLNLYNWHRDEIYSIIYTSGTTGVSKGVMHSIGNFDLWIRTVLATFDVPDHVSLFSYLPLSHVAERLAIESLGMYKGVVISFAESIESFSQNLFSAQPFLFFAVPRIWEKFKSGIQKKLPDKRLKLLLRIPLVSQLIKQRIRKKLGLAHTRVIYSSAAPISIDTLLYFDRLGIQILQLYGMTEDAALSHMLTEDDNRFGSVGKPMKGVKTKIADNGEIRVKSEALMKGYYKEPTLTTEAFDEEGYLKTGDQGEYDKDGFLFLTGRVKDLFKTAKGKFVSPSAIEMKLLLHPDIELACVVGNGLPQPIALVNLSEQAKTKSKSELCDSLLVYLDELNGSLDNFERIKKIIIIAEPWTVATGKITPTLKLKRNVLEKTYSPHYSFWYEERETLIWGNM